MGSKPKAPKPIDVKQVAGEQSQQNTQNAQQNAAYNRPNQTNQFGSTSQWRQTGTDANGNPTFEHSQQLGAEGQQFASGFSGLGQQYINQAGNFVGNRPDMSSTAAFDQADQFWRQREEPRLQQQQDALDNQLANKGFAAGSEGYTRAKDDLARQQGDQRAGFLSSAQSQFFNQGLADRNQEASELSLLNPGVNYGNQAINSGFSNVPGVNVSNVDMTNLYAQRQNQLNQNYQSDLASYNGMLGGIAGLGGTVLGAAVGGPMGAQLGASMFGGGMPKVGSSYNPNWNTTVTKG